MNQKENVVQAHLLENTDSKIIGLSLTANHGAEADAFVKTLLEAYKQKALQLAIEEDRLIIRHDAVGDLYSLGSETRSFSYRIHKSEHLQAVINLIHRKAGYAELEWNFKTTNQLFYNNTKFWVNLPELEE